MTQRYLVDGHWLESACIEAPEANAPAIVMLHEGLGSVAHWKDFPRRLSKATGKSVFLYSRYGHGGSDPLKEPRAVSYMHHEAQVVLPEILSQAGIERPLLFGQSDGASIAILYAAMFPGSARGLILEAPHVFVEDVTIASIARAREVYQHTDLSQRLRRYHDNADALFRGWNDIWLDPQFRNWNIESFLDAIQCPVLVIQGAQDEYGTVKQIESIQRRIPGTAAVILENCRHAPHRDQPEATWAAVTSFLHGIGRS